MRTTSEVDLARDRFDKAVRNLTVARDALALGHLEVAVERAYHSIYSAMRSLLALKNLDSRSHRGVITLFGKHLVRERVLPRQYHKIILEAKDLRERIDYGDFVKLSKKTAAGHVSNADLFLNQTQAVLRTMLLDMGRAKKNRS